MRYLAIVLGSARFPRCSLEPAASLRTSARRFMDYCEEILELQMDYDILDLFQSPELPGKQLQIISEFLKENLGSSPQADTDLILMVYYLGHGYFAKTDRSYCLAVAETTNDYTPSDGLQAKDLLFRVKNVAPDRRKLIIIDACFAASAMGDYTTLSDTDEAIRHELERNLDGWTAMYCAARSDELALAPRGSKFTLFSHGVLEALEKGTADLKTESPDIMSLTKLDETAWSIISEEFRSLGDMPRPLLFYPEKSKFTEGELIFPVAARERKKRFLADGKRFIEEELGKLKMSLETGIIESINSMLSEQTGVLDSLERRFTQQLEERLVMERASMAAGRADAVIENRPILEKSVKQVPLSGLDIVFEAILGISGGMAEVIRRLTSAKPLFVQGRRIRRRAFFLQWLLPFFFRPIRVREQKAEQVEQAGSKYRARPTNMVLPASDERETVLSASVAASEQRGFALLFCVFLTLGIALFVHSDSLPVSLSQLHLLDKLPTPRPNVIFPLTDLALFLLVSSVVAVIFWFLVGFLGYRQVIGGRQLSYRFFGMPISPGGTSLVFLGSILYFIWVVLTLFGAP